MRQRRTNHEDTKGETMENTGNWKELEETARVWLNVNDRAFWRIVRRLNALIMTLPLPQRTNDLLVSDIVSMAKLAQLEAFRDGLHRGKGITE